MANPDPPAAKRDLRARLRREAAGETASRESASRSLRLALLSWLDHPPAPVRSIAFFAAIPGEPDLLPLIAARPDLRWHLPRVAGGDLHFHLVTATDSLRPGVFQIPEPDPTAPAAAPGDIDLFLCPGMAFDRNGGRLGRGAGYYDRTLAGAKRGVVLCGVCFDSQVLPAVPVEPHDIRMAFLATESGVFAAGGE